jgi:hypothetical protein
MNPFPSDLASFTAALEQDLRSRGQPFEQRDVIDFAANVWTQARLEDPPDMARWGQECAVRCRVLARLREATAEGRQLYVHFLGRDGG